jgi:hypothetical protein
VGLAVGEDGRRSDAPERDAVAEAERRQQRIYEAGADADIVWQMGVWLALTPFVRFFPVPFVEPAAIVAHFVLLIAVPIAAAAWGIKYSGLTSLDPDWMTSQRKVALVAAVWGVFVGLDFLVPAGQPAWYLWR